MPRFLFFSHDGFGLGHVRRNCLVSHALLSRSPASAVTVVTGLPFLPAWLSGLRVVIVGVPPLLKDGQGVYRSAGMAFEAAVRRRAAAFAEAVDRQEPDVIIVDRHPYGIAGELRPGIERAAARGVRLVLGLRDILDEPSVVAAELAGAGWRGVADLYDQVIVYGGRHFCDHEQEYGLPVVPHYCGWVVEPPPALPREPDLLVVTAGGGGDGAGVFRLGVALAERQPGWRAELVAGPYADTESLRASVAASPARDRLRVMCGVAGCGALFARAAVVLQMAGYNSTFEALAAGQRPILVPRRQPRQEQAIRARRLAALGLADVADEDAEAAEVDALLRRPRRVTRQRVERASIRLDGAEEAAATLERLAVGALR